MQLWWNDSIVSRAPTVGELDLAVERLCRGGEEDCVELRRDERVKMLAGKGGGVEGGGYYVELWWGDVMEGYFLPPSARRKLRADLRAYLAGGMLRPSGDGLDPDCPLCAMLAEQIKREGRSSERPSSSGDGISGS